MVRTSLREVRALLAETQQLILDSRRILERARASRADYLEAAARMQETLRAARTSAAASAHTRHS